MPVFTNVYEIVAQGTVATTGSGAKNFFNVFHYYTGSGSAPQAPSAVSAAFRDQCWTAGIAPALNIAYTGVQILCRLLDDAEQQYVADTTGPSNGVTTGPRLPTHTQVRLRIRGLTRGRNFRGAKLLGPVTDTDVDKDELTPAAYPKWNVAASKVANYIVTSSGDTFYPLILSRTMSQLRTNPTRIIGSRFASVMALHTVGTVRRRKEKSVL